MDAWINEGTGGQVDEWMSRWEGECFKNYSIIYGRLYAAPLRGAADRRPEAKSNSFTLVGH